MPRIYVADLAAYNAGRLHGAWIDLEGKDADDVFEEIQERVLDTSPEPFAEEYAIHDHEGFGGYPVHEYDNIRELVAIAEMMEEHGEGPIGAFLSYHVNYYGGEDDVASMEMAASDFEESYRGKWPSEEEYAENFLEETGQLSEIPEWAQPYFDMRAYARTMFMDDHYSIDAEEGGGVYVFTRI